MKETHVAKIKLFVMLAAFVIVGGYLARVYVDAKSPSSVKVTVYKVEFMTDGTDAQPLVVFLSTAGKVVDLASETFDVVGQARPAAGVYKRIRLTVKNGYKMSIADAENNPCGGELFTDRDFPLVEGTDLNSQVPLFFAADVDGGGAWKGAQVTNLLIRPITASQNLATKVKLRFIVDDTLFCPGGEVARRAPWSVWPEIAL